MSVFGPVVEPESLLAECADDDGQLATDPVTNEPLEAAVAAFKKGRACYTPGPLARWLSTRSAAGLYKNTDPLTREPFTVEERKEVFRLAGEADPAGNLVAHLDESTAADAAAEEQLINQYGNLYTAAVTGNQTEVARLHGAGLNLAAQNNLPLRLAAAHNRLPVVEFILVTEPQAALGVNEALWEALLAGNVPVIKRLLLAGAEADWENYEDLRQAAANGRRIWEGVWPWR